MNHCSGPSLEGLFRHFPASSLKRLGWWVITLNSVWRDCLVISLEKSEGTGVVDHCYGPNLQVLLSLFSWSSLTRLGWWTTALVTHEGPVSHFSGSNLKGWAGDPLFWIQSRGAGESILWTKSEGTGVLSHCSEISLEIPPNHFSGMSEGTGVVSHHSGLSLSTLQLLNTYCDSSSCISEIIIN